MIWVTWVCDTSDMAFSPKGVIWVLSIFERIRLSRYCAAIRERNSCLYRICKKNKLCSKYNDKMDVLLSQHVKYVERSFYKESIS